MFFGLKSDGTVWACNHNEPYNVRQIASGIVAISAGDDHIVCLKADGTVAAYGEGYNSGCLAVGDWKDIVAVYAGDNGYDGVTIGLKADGTLVATRRSSKLADWKLWH